MQRAPFAWTYERWVPFAYPSVQRGPFADMKFEIVKESISAPKCVCHMETDKIFVLLLVILLPLTGCIDLTDNAEGQDGSLDTTIDEINHPPVIWGSIYFGSHYCANNSTSIDDVIVTRAVSAVDYDGNITEFGLDTDQDGVIDFHITDMCEGADYQAILGTNDSSSWFEPLEMNTWGGASMDIEYCYQNLALIAIDDDGSIGVEPFTIYFEYDERYGGCLFEPN